MVITSEYPSAQTDPLHKGYDWILQYCQAAHTEGQSYMSWLMGNVHYRRLEEIRAYGMGKQTINKYKKRQPGDAIDNNAEANNDYSVVPIICRFREIIISRLLRRAYDIQAFAIDPLAKSEEDKVFNQMKVKVMMREAAMQAGSELANSPLLKQGVGEPSDMEELNMQMEFGYKDTLCMEAEEGIQLIMQQNGIEERRKRVIENLVDYGLAGYTQWIDETGQCKFRDINARNLLTSYCTRNDFSDMVHWGEYLEMNLIDLAPYFSPDQMDKIQQQVAGKNNNPRLDTPFRRAWARYKVCVLDFKLLTDNTYVYENEVDGRGNERFGKTHYQNLQFIQNSNIPSEGEQTPKYMKSTEQVMYKCKWIVDTDMMYDWGISENQSRKKSSWWLTSLDVELYAWNFDNMMFTGITERMIPIADAYYLTWQKIQNLKNKLIPYLIELDLNAIESAALGAGGKKMTPQEIVDFAFSNFIVLTRKTDLLNRNPNYKAMQIEASGQLQAFVFLYQDLQNCINMLYDISGLNQITAGDTPNAKTLTPGYDNANIGTDNALYLLGLADRNLMLRLADSIVCKIQIAVKLGAVEGYLKPLGEGTVKFLQINPDLSLIELGIFLNDAPTYEEWQLLYQELSMKEAQGLLEPADIVIIKRFRNLTQAQRYLAYVVKKRKQEMQQFEMAKIEKANEGNIQATATASALKIQEQQMLSELKIEEINVQMQWQYFIDYMKKQSDIAEGAQQADAKVISNQIMAQAKVISQQIMANARRQQQKSA